MTTLDTDRHEDPPVRVSDDVKIELEAERILSECSENHWQGYEECVNVGEQVDPYDFARVFWQLFRSRTPQERDEAHTECQQIARAAAERIAKLRAEHPI